MAKPTLISLFSGAGGLDYGFEAAGFRTGVALERDAWCCTTLRHNRPKWDVVERDIFEVPTEELLERAGSKKGEIDLVIGGPPCQPFSKSSYWRGGDTRRLHDPRAATLAAYLRVVDEALPRAFLLENVEGLAYEEKGEGIAYFERQIKLINRRRKTNYRLNMAKLNAASFGVPQVRSRFFVVASRDGDDFAFPTPTHGDPLGFHGLDPTLQPYCTAWDALSDLNVEVTDELAARGKWATLLPSIPEGQNYLWHTARSIEAAVAENKQPGKALFGWRCRYWTFLLKLAKARPSWTIQAQPGPSAGPFHWDNRRLSAKELCRLQTFPDDIALQGALCNAQKQAGNAVPSLLAEVIAREIRTQLLGCFSLRGAPKLLRHATLAMPPPVRPRAVPKELLAYEGQHAEHPGIGEGPEAMRRRPNNVTAITWARQRELPVQLQLAL